MSKLTNTNGLTTDQIFEKAKKLLDGEMTIYIEQTPEEWEGTYLSWFIGPIYEYDLWAEKNLGPGMVRRVVARGPLSEMKKVKHELLQTFFQSEEIVGSTGNQNLRGIWMHSPPYDV